MTKSQPLVPGNVTFGNRVFAAETQVYVMMGCTRVGGPTSHVTVSLKRRMPCKERHRGETAVQEQRLRTE